MCSEYANASTYLSVQWGASVGQSFEWRLVKVFDFQCRWERRLVKVFDFQCRWERRLVKVFDFQCRWEKARTA
jgi:hypothetical protein